MTITATLTTKTYLATTVEAALELARRELGSDAMLVTSRAAPEEVRHMGRYEVVFAFEKPRVPKPSPALAEGPLESSTLRKLLESSGLETPLARDLIYDSLRQNANNGRQEPLWCTLKAEMASRIRVDSRLGQTVALVGPPGRGKTTTLAKLAVLEGLAKGKPLRLLSAGQGRLGADTRLQALAAAAGIPFQACPTVGDLDRALQSRQGLTLIDTPGFGPGDLIESVDWAAYLCRYPEINVHLVLRCDTKPADVSRTVEMYSGFGAARVIFTGLDEIQGPGALFGSIAKLQGAVSFFANGQRIPQDLQSASKARILEPIFEQWEESISAAA